MTFTLFETFLIVGNAIRLITGLFVVIYLVYKG